MLHTEAQSLQEAYPRPFSSPMNYVEAVTRELNAPALKFIVFDFTPMVYILVKSNPSP